MPLISEAQKKALVKLCAEHSRGAPIKDICALSTVRAYVELLEEIEKLKEKEDERQG